MMENGAATRTNVGHTVAAFMLGATQEKLPAVVIPQRSDALQTANASHTTNPEIPIANPPVVGSDPNNPNIMNYLSTITESNSSIFSKSLVENLPNFFPLFPVVHVFSQNLDEDLHKSEIGSETLIASEIGFTWMVLNNFDSFLLA